MQKILNNMRHIMRITYRFENLMKSNEGQRNAKVRKLHRNLHYSMQTNTV